MVTLEQIKLVKEWLLKAPFDNYIMAYKNPTFSYDEWFEEGRTLPEIVECLIKILTNEPYDPPTNLNFGAAYALGWFGDRRAVPVLMKALNSTQKIVRMEACASLGRLGDTAAFDAILMLLEDEDLNVRANVCIALGNLHAPGSEKALRRAIKDSEPFVVECAMEGLRLLKEKD